LYVGGGPTLLPGAVDGAAADARRGARGQTDGALQGVKASSRLGRSRRIVATPPRSWLKVAEIDSKARMSA